jgi:hypothetical protein
VAAVTSQLAFTVTWAWAALGARVAVIATTKLMATALPLNNHFMGRGM